MKKKFSFWQLGSSAVRKWKVESGKWKVSNALRANVNKLAFSLVELMISLIVISIVTAAFAPVLTKKLKTSDQSIGTATAVSITSSAVCNSVSKGCIECENDKCLAVSDGYFLNESTGKSQHCNTTITGCAQCDSSSKCTKSEDGYYINGNSTSKCSSPCTKCSGASSCSTCENGYFLSGSSCVKCNTSISNCSVCSSSSVCTTCADYYYKNGNGCSACPAHCKNCINSTACSVCESGYSLTANRHCWKYVCDNLICVLTPHQGNPISVYRYNIGDSVELPAGVNRCYAGASCPYPDGTPRCWSYSFYYMRDTADTKSCTAGSTYSSYSGCARTDCNYYAQRIINTAYSAQGWKLPTYAQMEKFHEYLKGYNHSFVDPFCASGNSRGGKFPLCPPNQECGGPMGFMACWSYVVAIQERPTGAISHADIDSWWNTGWGASYHSATILMKE